MKKTIFWANVLLNIFALGSAILWSLSQPGYESWASVLALAASTLSLLYSKPYWNQQKSINSVSIISSTAGGDIAGGNISKRDSINR